MSNRIVKLPPIESFGHLTPDKWLLLKTLEEAAEMVEAGKPFRWWHRNVERIREPIRKGTTDGLKSHAG